MSKKTGVVDMKKVIFILLLISLGVGVYIYKANADVAYDTVSKHGITLEVPNYLKEEKEKDTNEYFYINKSKSFAMAINSFSNDGLSIEEYIDTADRIIAYDAINWKSLFGSSISDIDVKQTGIEVINGIEMGYMVLTCSKYQGKNKITLKLMNYVINLEDEMVGVVLGHEIKDRQKYQEVIDHILNSITIQ